MIGRTTLVLSIALIVTGCSKKPEVERTTEQMADAPVTDIVEEVEIETEKVAEQSFAGSHPDIPSNANKHRRRLIRHAQYHHGMNAPVPVYAAQIHKESTWRQDVCSPFACGLTQFTDSTADYVGEKFEALENVDVMNPDWAINAQILYMDYLIERARGQDNCNAWAKALSAYNGGIGWLRRDEKVTEAQGADKTLWWDNVEVHKDPRRSDAAVRENTNYPRRILLDLQVLYSESGFASGPLICENL